MLSKGRVNAGVADKKERPYVAVAADGGFLVNRHLGKVKSLMIYRKTESGFLPVGCRNTPSAGTGDFRWIRLAALLGDCRALLVAQAGNNPVNILEHSGIRVIRMNGLIDEGLEKAFNNSP